MSIRVCEHGQLARSCNICELESELAAARRETAEHPSLDACFAAGRGPGLPDTPEERARFESYMRGHCWDIGEYDNELRCYDTTLVRMLYGVWRDRGALDLSPFTGEGK